MKVFYDAIAGLVPEQATAHLITADLSDPPVASDYPYVVVWGSAPTAYSGDGPDEPTAGDRPDAVLLDVRLTIAALSLTQLDLAVSGVHAALNRVVPVVSGYRCNRIRLVSLLPAQPDRDLYIGGVNPIYTVEEFTLRATKETSP
ncbi:hypothetical protein BJH93_04135 [Kocuria polaris]|nr:hypothetical protein [Kocuria polaris]